MPYDRDIDDSEREDIRRRFSLLVEIGQLLDEEPAPPHLPREAPPASVAPVVTAPTEEVQARLRRLERMLGDLQAELAQRAVPAAERDPMMPNLLAAIEALDRRQEAALATLRAELAEMEARGEASIDARIEAAIAARVAALRPRARPAPVVLIGAALLLVGLALGALVAASAPTGALRTLGHDRLPRIAVQHLPAPAIAFLREHGLLPKVFIEPAAMPAVLPPVAAEPPPVTPPPVATPAPAAEPAPPAPTLENAAPDVRQLRSDPDPGAVPPTNTPAPAGNVTGSAEPAATPTLAPVFGPAPAPVPVVAALNAPTPEPAVLPAPAQAAGEPPQHLTLRARSDAWVQVRDRQGHVLLNRLMRAGEAWVVPEPGMLLSTGNAAATELVVDGAEPRVLGSVGSVRRDIPLDADLVRSGKLGTPSPARTKAAPLH